MQADLEDLDPSLRKELEEDEEYMRTQTSRKSGTPMTPPAGMDEED